VDLMGRAGLRRGLEVPGRKCRQAGTAAGGPALLSLLRKPAGVDPGAVALRGDRRDGADQQPRGAPLLRGVLLRQHAFGSPSEVGRFVERLLTVAQTCRLLGRSVRRYLLRRCSTIALAFLRPPCFPPSERLPEGNYMRVLERSRLPTLTCARRSMGPAHARDLGLRTDSYERPLRPSSGYV
jgi:hypothetical protein